MLASELIAELQEQIDKHGDLVVKYHHMSGETTPKRVGIYDESGYFPDEPSEAVEIFIY